MIEKVKSHKSTATEQLLAANVFVCVKQMQKLGKSTKL